MSPEFVRALEFIERCEACAGLEELERALRATFDTFGVPHYTLGAMLRSAPGASPTFTTLVRGVSEEWATHYWDQKYLNADAAVHVAMQRSSMFSWSDVEALNLPKTSARLFDEIRDAMDIRGGLVIPVHDAAGFAGIVALHHEDRELPRKAAQALKLISMYAVERAKELYLNETPPLALPCPLSMRQREILSYAAQGKSESDTGDILGIAASTVREHLEKVRETLGVRTKMQAAAIAVHRGWIAL